VLEEDPALSGHNDILGAAHAPTARVMHQLRQARHQLQRVATPELGLSPAIRALWRTEMRLDRPLRVALCGEVNAGKSTLANLLAGIESLPTAVISHTLFPTLLYYAPQPEIWMAQENGERERLRSNRSLTRDSIFRIEVGLPAPRLAAMQVLDLPGFVGYRSGGPFTSLAAHRVDATIWCTVSTQAWKESERSAWSTLSPRLNARSLLVATHADLLREADREKLKWRLQEEVGASFTSILLMSTLEAIAVMGRDSRSGPGWLATGAEVLEAGLAALLARVREQRAAAALSVTSRIAKHTLARIDG
jgi:hypothetical protein